LKARYYETVQVESFKPGSSICTDAVLKINVVEGRDMMPMDMTGKSDPYVVLSMGD